MSGHANGINDPSQGSSSQGSYPVNAWAFAAADFNNASATQHQHHQHQHQHQHHPNSTAGGPRPNLYAQPQQQQQSGGKRRHQARTGPYETAAARRGHLTAAGSSARDRRTQGQGQRVPGQSADPERKRVVVACARCRKRKIRCSGDDGMGGACTSCRNANEPSCIFMRVMAGSVSDVRKQKEEMRLDKTPATPNFNYDLDACRQYQSRGAASVGPLPMSVTSAPSMYGSGPPPSGSAAAFASGGPVGNVLYNWTPGVVGGGAPAAAYADESTSNDAHMGYGMAYGGMPYNGMPSPDTSYMGENDLMERPSTASMADAGAFALQSMSQGLPPTSSHGSSPSSPYGMHTGAGAGRAMPTSTPRSIPGPAPNVLGSTRGVAPSSVFSGPRGGVVSAPQYPSPATTPITSGVSPAWTGYEQSPYATPAMPASMAAQSLERLPELYSATPPPPSQSLPNPSSAESAAEGGAGAAGDSRHGSQGRDDQHAAGSGGGSPSQTQSQHFGQYDFGESRAHGGERAQRASGVDMV